MSEIYDVVVAGAGAAGIGAARRLARAGVSFAVAEARPRVGGRALTLTDTALDLGCGWLHSAQNNVWTGLAEAGGFHVEQTPSPWRRQTGAQGFSEADQAAFHAAFARFEQRIDEDAERQAAAPASFYLEPGDRWTPLLNAVFSYISGASLEEIDARDYARYEDTGVNWRVREGYGALIAAHAAEAPLLLETRIDAIDHSGATLRLETTRGALEARTAIITAPTSVLDRIRFTPPLPEKIAAAEALPLGAAEKLFFALEGADAFPEDAHFFGRIDRAETGSYHFRSMRRPIVEAYFGGALARGLAQVGPEAMAAFAKKELAALLGAQFPRRLSFIAASSWSTDALTLGGYSYARPGEAEARQALAAPVEGRLFFAGEACSKHRYSTAHGAFETGCAAAEQALASLAQAPSPRA